jgi:hypothetical protein
MFRHSVRRRVVTGVEGRLDIHEALPKLAAAIIYARFVDRLVLASLNVLLVHGILYQDIFNTWGCRHTPDLTVKYRPGNHTAHRRASRAALGAGPGRQGRQKPHI